MNNLITELERKEILTARAVAELRKYIAAKFPSMPSEQRARVFADAVNRVVDANIPEIAGEHRRKLKGILYRDAINKPDFRLDRSQVFIAALGVEADDSSYFEGMTSWLGDSLGYELDQESVASFIIRVQRLKDEVPGFSILDALEAVETGLVDVLARKDDKAVDRPVHEDFPDDIQSVDKHAGSDSAGIFSEKATAGWIQPAEAESVESDEADPNEAELNEAEPDLTVMQMMALCGKTLGSRRRKSVAAHAGRILIAAGFTGFILSSLLDMDIFTVKGAPGTALSADMEVQSNEVRDYRLESYLNSYLGRYADSSAALDEYISDGLSLVAEGKKTVKATAYDLSFGSCGKRPGDPGYGITASGVKAQKGRTIAVDPEYIPLGTRVYITFPEEYAGMDGVYVAEDTGRLIKGWHIDIFFGEDKKGQRKVYESAMKFGIRQVDIEILD